MSLYKTHQKPPILTSNYICSQRVIKRAINLETFFSEKITFKAKKKRCIQKESIFHQKYQVNWESTQILRKAEGDTHWLGKNYYVHYIGGHRSH